MASETPSMDSKTVLAPGSLDHVQDQFRYLWRPTPRAQPPREVRNCTHEEVARALGVTHQRAQQIERAALRKLRRWCAQHGLRLEDLIG